LILLQNPLLVPEARIRSSGGTLMGTETFAMIRRLRSWIRNEAGAAAGELALTLPLIGTLLFAIIKFGIVYNNYLALTAGVANAARQFSIGRTVSTPASTAASTLTSSAPNLAPASLSITATVAGNSACINALAPSGTTASDATCLSQLTTAAGNAQSATFTATYTVCDLVVMGVNFAPNCKLTASATELVE